MAKKSSNNTKKNNSTKKSNSNAKNSNTKKNNNSAKNSDTNKNDNSAKNSDTKKNDNNAKNSNTNKNDNSAKNSHTQKNNNNIKNSNTNKSSNNTKNSNIHKSNSNFKKNINDGKISNKPSEEEKFMDFSQIDEEHKGELRRPLTPKERFFRVCEKFGDLFLLNVFFTLTSLPVVTVGASFTAMYTITLKMVRNEDVPIKKGYFDAFKKNFKQSTQLWAVILVIIILMYKQFQVVLNNDSSKADFLVMALGLEMLVLSFVLPLLFPMIARYENTNLNMIKNSLIASFLHLGTWATVYFLWVIPVIMYYLRPTLFVYTWYLWFVFLSSFVAYTCSHRLWKMFDKIEEERG